MILLKSPMSLIHRLERISDLTGGRALFLEEINPNSYILQWYTSNSLYVTSLLKGR